MLYPICVATPRLAHCSPTLSADPMDVETSTLRYAFLEVDLLGLL